MNHTSEGLKHWTQEEVRRFFDAIPRENIRDRLLFGMIYRYGMRTQEACLLPARSVDLARGEITIQGMKRGLLRRYTLFGDLAKLARRYQPGPFTYFHGRQGPLSRQRVWTIFTLFANEARLARCGVHVLRHSLAVHMLDAGHDVVTVQDMLRHRSIKTTMNYAVLSIRRRGDYLAALEWSDNVVRVA